MPDETVAGVRRALNVASAAELPELILRFSADSRPGVVDAVAKASRQLARETAEIERLERMAECQARLHSEGFAVIAGADEVGRGCLAGPVTAGAVVLDAFTRIPGLDDSKRLTPETRVVLDKVIRQHAVAVAVAHVDPPTIDAVGIVAANVFAMRRAVEALGTEVDHVLVDGLPVDVGRPSTAVVGGDRLVSAIAAASIVAKVERDALMRELHHEFPEYDFAGNKGYGTVEHIEVIRRIGPCRMHRMSFAPCGQDSLF